MPEPCFSHLQLAPLRDTAARLERRIAERFPGSGLARVAGELVRLAAGAALEVAALQRPLWGLRALTVLGGLALAAMAGWVAFQAAQAAGGGPPGMIDLLQGIEAATNEVLLLAAGLLFLSTLETRARRRRALDTLYRLRSLAHIIDMHQLTKDPEPLVFPIGATASSPSRTLTRAELGRYLDYCSEMLAVVGKLAAVHAERLQDPVVLDTVNEIESLTSGLSMKIWQKLLILAQLPMDGVSGDEPPVG